MSEPFYEFHVIYTLEESLDSKDRTADEWDAEMARLGKEGWHIAGIGREMIYLQRLVQEESPDERPPADAPPDEETVDPLCGCGCGDSVVIGLSAWKMAIDRGMVWFIAGHGAEAAQHNGPYMAAPRRARSEA